MIILGIETSCDETAAAILAKDGDRVTILSNIIASSAPLQAKYGGIIPEQAAREQLKAIIPVIETAISNSRLKINKIDAIAVTYGPGLIGSLLIGVETAKVLATIWQKPLIPVNHLIGHFYANFIDLERLINNKTNIDKRFTINNIPKFPCLGLLVSGGHTDLVLFESNHEYKYLGGTRDDAAGECFDKCARLLGFPYPGGPIISKLAQTGNPKAFDFPRPMLDSNDFDFSFSGLKTAFAREVQNSKLKVQTGTLNTNNHQPSTINHKLTTDLAASLEQAIIDVLIEKTVKAARVNKVKQIIVAGGVAANQKLSQALKQVARQKARAIVYIPPPYLCTDNAAMIAAAAFFQKPTSDPLKLQAEPNLSLS